MIIATATQMKNNFGKYLDLANKYGEILVERNGVIVAKLLANQKKSDFIINNLKGIGKNNEKSID